MLLWHSQLTYSRLQIFAEAIHQVSGAPGIWGFVNDTFQDYCRPTGNEEQQRVYSEHKKLHDNNYQAIVTPDELVSSLTGLFMGSINN